MTMRHARALAVQELLAVGVEEADVDAIWLLGHILGLTRTQVLLHLEDELSPVQEKQFWKVVRERKKRKPLQYILGTAPFMDLTLRCTSGVLIPREETALLVQWALEVLPKEATLCDLCCGSGAIAVAALEKRRLWHAYCCDISAKAVALTTSNLEAFGLMPRATVLRGNMLSALPRGISLDAVLCNPPYIADGYPLSPEIIGFEPKAALFGGKDGLRFYRNLARSVPAVLKKGGKLFVEFGQGQQDDVRKILTHGGFTWLGERKDMAGIIRCGCAQW